MKSFSQFLKEEIENQAKCPFDDLEPGTIIRVMAPEPKEGMGTRPVYLVWRGRVGENLCWRFSDDSYGNEFTDALVDKHFHRRQRDVICTIDRIPSWLKNYTVMSNIKDHEAKRFS